MPYGFISITSCHFLSSETPSRNSRVKPHYKLYRSKKGLLKVRSYNRSVCSGSILLTTAPSGYKEQLEDYEKEFQRRRDVSIINVTNPVIHPLIRILNCIEKLSE